MHNIVIHTSGKLDIEDRGDYWTALLKPTGIRVYADSEDALRTRATYAIEFVCSVAQYAVGVSGLRAYLDKHKVDYDIEENTVLTVGDQPMVEVALGV